VPDLDGPRGRVRGSVPAVSRTARQVVALLGFLFYSGGLIAFVEAPDRWSRVIAALVTFAGLVAAGKARWGMPMPGD
jgi:hypothetical protein